MYYQIKGSNVLYTMMNEADESGLCQVLDLNTNQLCLVRKEYLIPVEDTQNDKIKDVNTQPSRLKI